MKRSQNGGIEPVPLREPFDVEAFNPALVSADEDVAAMHAAIKSKPGSWAGKQVAVIGRSGTGRTSIAQHLATATGQEPRIVQLDTEALMRFPNHAHAGDMERSKLDGIPVVFEDATHFLLRSKDHPFLERVADHPMPTFFVGDVPAKVEDSELEDALSQLTFVARTGPLSRAQLKEACHALLGVEVENADIAALKDVTIGSVVTVRDQLQAMDKVGDKDEAIRRLSRVRQRAKEHEPDKGQMGFVGMVAGRGEEPKEARR